MNRSFAALVFVVIAGEAVFMPPFVIPRLYRPLMLDAWNLTNTDFGTAFIAYGITALISYLVGGPLADKYHPRVLIASSLLMTAMAGIYLAFFPSKISLIFTYAFFGASTILLLWGALIKTTHVAGGDDQRSLAMGVLDSGRGLTAAIFASLLILVLSQLPLEMQAAPSQSLLVIYLLTGGLLTVIAAGVWFSLKKFVSAENTAEWKLADTGRCLKDPNVWLLSFVVLGSYCGYKGIDNYSLYLVDVQGVTADRAAQLTSILFWLRPVAALITGLVADRLNRKNGVGRFQVLFALLAAGCVSQFALAFLDHNVFIYGFATILFSASLVYALRAVYFSVFGDLKIPNHLVGTTVGIVSFVGFLPDIFFGIVTARLLDTHPGVTGFQYSFIFTGAWLLIGTVASYLLSRRAYRALNSSQ